MSILILNSSIKRGGSTDALAEALCSAVARLHEAPDLLALDADTMPWCDGGACFGDPRTRALMERVARARAILVVCPIYNYACNAALKNFLELTGSDWNDKVVGLACTAGGPGSYMSIMSFAASLMLDHRCLVVPRFVYATGAHFAERRLADPDLVARVDDLVTALLRHAGVTTAPLNLSTEPLLSVSP